MHVQFHRCGDHEFSQPTILRRKSSEGVGGNKLFIRLTVEVLDSEPTRCFRAALDQYLIGKLRIVGSVDALSLWSTDRSHSHSWSGSTSQHCYDPTVRETCRDNWTHSSKDIGDYICWFLIICLAKGKMRQRCNVMCLLNIVFKYFIIFSKIHVGGKCCIRLCFYTEFQLNLATILLL